MQIVSDGRRGDKALRRGDGYCENAEYQRDKGEHSDSDCNDHGAPCRGWSAVCSVPWCHDQCKQWLHSESVVRNIIRHESLSNKPLGLHPFTEGEFNGHV